MQKIFGLFLFLLCKNAIAAIIFAGVPFETLTLQPNDFIRANYTFGVFSMIYCFENNLQFDPPVGVMTFSFNGQLFSAPLSSTTLVLNGSTFQGLPADPKGVIQIQNISSTPLVVNCEFGY